MDEKGFQPRVLVAGATGYLGGHVVAALKKRGYWVRALSRREGEFQDCEYPPDDVFVGQATRPESLEGLCDGIDFVFSSLGITRQTDRVTFWDVDYGANKTVLTLAERAGVQKFVFVSIFRPKASSHLDIVAAREKLVGELAAGEISACIIRPTGYFSDLEELLEMARRGWVFLPGSGESRMNPIHGADLAEVCVDALSSDQDQIEVGGPQVLTYDEMAILAFEAVKKKPRVVHLPLWLLHFAVWIVSCFSRELATTLSFFIDITQLDMVAPPCGRHALSDHYRARALLTKGVTSTGTTEE